MQLRHLASYVGLFVAAVSSVATSAPEPDWTVKATPFERVITLTDAAPTARCEALLHATDRTSVTALLSWVDPNAVRVGDRLDVHFVDDPDAQRVKTLAVVDGRTTSLDIQEWVPAGDTKVAIEIAAQPGSRLPISVHCRFEASFSGDGDRPAGADASFRAP